ncbi:MAG: PilZ domain-containing protein [Methylobacteriaceae bacterium]|nr:PilZ domain-containing protein [Methylobacteriaceae bacterium]
MSEQRSAERTRTFLRGRIEYNGGQSSFDCLVRDLSEHGARVVVSEAVTLPETFRLHIPKNDRSETVHVKWRRGESVGVSFEPVAAQAGAPHDEDKDRIRLLEAEIVRLRRVLEELRGDPSRIQILLDKAV